MRSCKSCLNPLWAPLPWQRQSLALLKYVFWFLRFVQLLLLHYFVKEALKHEKKLLAKKPLKKARLQRFASKTLGLNRKRIYTKPQQRGRRSMTEETKVTVGNFYEAMANPLPEKKLVSKKTGKPRMILSRPVSQLYEQFKVVHTNVKYVAPISSSLNRVM